MLIVILLLLFMVWGCAPAFSGLEADFTEFTKIYPNRYKQLIVIFLHGPFVIIIFGWFWIGANAFKHSTTILSIRQWLRK